MHQVLQHIWNRRNKKVPINDGRKVALVLYGGAMMGIRGAGALHAFLDIGLGSAFDSVYALSAGFCNAAYFLSNQPTVGISIYLEDLSSSKFIDKMRLWRVINIQYVIDLMTKTKILDVKAILKSKTKLYIGLSNLNKKSEQYLEVHKFGPKKFFDLMRAAISVPYLSPGSIKIGPYKYKDYPYDQLATGRHLIKVIEDGATDILVIYNNLNQVPQLISLTKYMHKIYAITPGNLKMSYFEKNPKLLLEQENAMYKKVMNIFTKHANRD